MLLTMHDIRHKDAGFFYLFQHFNYTFSNEKQYFCIVILFSFIVVDSLCIMVRNVYYEICMYFLEVHWFNSSWGRMLNVLF